MSTDETMVGRGPAGDAFLALVHALEPALVLARQALAIAEEYDAVHVASFREAVALATAAYERLEAHGPEVADGAARLVATLYLSPLRMREDVREFVEPLEAALRKLTEQPKAASREKS